MCIYGTINKGMSGFTNIMLSTGGASAPVGVDIDLFATTFLPADDTGIISSVARGLFVNQAQTKIYTADDTGDLIRAGDITTDLSTYVENSVSPDVGRPFACAASETGDSIYYDGNTVVAQRDLAVTNDLSSAGGSVATFNAGTGSPNLNQIRGLHIDVTGTNFYVGSGNGEVVWLVLSTPWDLSTAIREAYYLSPVVGVGGWGISFDASGTKMYMAVFNTHEIYQHELSTPWDISTASHSGKILTMTGAAANSPVDIHMGYTGDVIYVHLFDTDNVIALRAS